VPTSGVLACRHRHEFSGCGASQADLETQAVEHPGAWSVGIDIENRRYIAALPDEPSDTF
jgi:hypothetical protein